MITNSSSPVLLLCGDSASSLSAKNIDECTNARTEKDLESLWGRIKDWFFGTHRVDAKLALYRMLNAETTAVMQTSYLDLLRYVEPEHRQQLAWLIGEQERPAFQIGGYVVPSKVDWASQVPSEPPPSVADMAKLLLSLRYKGLPVLETLREVGLCRIVEAAREEGLPEAKAEVNADRMLDAQQWFLGRSPSLVDALELIGLHRNDDDGELAYQLRLAVEQALGGEDDDKAAVMSRNAENLMCLVTDMFHDREHLKRTALSANLPTSPLTPFNRAA